MQRFTYADASAHAQPKCNASLRLSQHSARASPARPYARADRHSGTPLKKPKVAFADDDDADAKPAPGAATRGARHGSPPPPPPVTPDAAQFRSWQRVATEIQGALRDAPLPQGTQWPCCQRFLTGKCGSDCRTCTRAGKPQRGDQQAREVATKTLARLVKASKLSTECAEQVRAGERERA